MSLFNDPNQSRILWHDLKTFPSAATICLETILKNVYGEISPQLQTLIEDLRCTAITQTIQLENLSIIQKSTLQTLALTDIRRTIKTDLDSALNYLSPLLKSKQISTTIDLPPNQTMNGDARYSTTILQNILYIIIASAGQTSAFNISSKSNQIIFTITNLDPEITPLIINLNKTTEDLLYTDTGPIDTQLKLAWFSNELLNQKLNQLLAYTITDTTLTLLYDTH